MNLKKTVKRFAALALSVVLLASVTQLRASAISDVHGYSCYMQLLADYIVYGGNNVPFNTDRAFSGMPLGDFTIPSAGTYLVDYGVNITAGAGASVAVAVGSVVWHSEIKMLKDEGVVSGSTLMTLYGGEHLTLRNTSTIPFTMDTRPGAGAWLNVVRLDEASADYGIAYQQGNETVNGGADVAFSRQPAGHGVTGSSASTFKVSTAGTYLVDYNVNLSAGAGAELAVAVNGTVDPSTNRSVLGAPGQVSGTALLDLSAGDELTLRNNSATPMTLDANCTSAQMTIVLLKYASEAYGCCCDLGAPQNVPGGGYVSFGSNGPLRGVSHTAGTPDITVSDDGKYLVKYGANVAAGTGADISLEVGGAIDPPTKLNVLSSDGIVSGAVMMVLSAGDTVRMINQSATALTLDGTPGVGAWVQLVRLSAADLKPAATTDAASSISATEASLHGTVDAKGLNTAVSFEFGETTAYGTTLTATPDTVTGYGDTSVGAGPTGLTPNTTYHFRVKAENARGITYGSDRTFTTDQYGATATPSAALTEANLDGSSVTVTLLGTTFADGVLDKANFTLNNAPAGLTIDSVTYDGVDQCTLQLAFDGTDFDTHIVNFCVTVGAAELSLGSALTTNTMNIQATVETLPLVFLGISGTTMTEAGGSVTVTATLSGTLNQDVTVALGYTGTATGGGTDYTATGAAITIPKGGTTGSVTVTAVNDALYEGNETVIVDITGVTNGTEYHIPQQVAAMIIDDDVQPPPPPGGGGGGNDTGDEGGNVEVNGESHSAGTSQTTTNSSGQTVTTFTVDTQQLQDILENQGQGATVTIPVTTGSDVASGVLSGDMIGAMEAAGATLVIDTGSATYTLPAGEIDINAVAAQFGVPPADITVTVSVSTPADDMVTVVENTAEDGGFALVVPAVEFTVTCTCGDQTAEVTSFDAYVDRTITIPDGVDPSQVTTAVIVAPDGTTLAVPTEVVYDSASGHWVAVIHSMTNSVYAVIWNPVAFPDVADHWAKDAVNDMGSRMIVTGDEDGNYNPDNSVNRAEFAAMIVRALGLSQSDGENSFDDVSPDDWFAGYVETAAAYGLITGYTDHMFKPGDTITREQAMVILARAMAITGIAPDVDAGAVLLNFNDGTAVSDYAKYGVAACIETGIVNGKTHVTIAPEDAVTRAEVAVMLQRFLQQSELI